jgi:glycosyltransferase involved in cell wall biosynthesis
MSAPNTSPAASRPLVSIVTPSLNSAKFIRQTIESVAAQDYPRIEHVVMDGGSTDGTLEILASFPLLTVFSAPDCGTPDAINRGFEHTHGEYFSYLNSDDLLLPGAISAAVERLGRAPEVGAIYGDAWWIDEHGRRIGAYPVQDFDSSLLGRECFICQPASLMRSSAFDNAGRLDPDLDLTFDYELWMRLARIYPLRRIHAPLAYSRMHLSNKSLGRRAEVLRETFAILRRHYGYVPFSWIYSYVCHRADGRDQFFEPIEPSIARYVESLPVGLSVNRRAKARYLAEWAKVMSWPGLRRRLSSHTSRLRAPPS